MTQQSDILALIHERRRLSRKARPYAQRRSQLERHRVDILTLKEDGASLGDIQYFLRVLAKPSMTVARSTIKRFLDHIEPTA